MSKLAMLELLRELVRDAVIMHTDPEDASGLSTKYYVDQEQFLRNMEAAIDAESTCSER